MKALLLSHSDGGGGAGRAAGRLLSALAEAGVDCRMHVDFKDSADPRVTRNAGLLADAARRLRITIEEVPAVLARHPQPRLFSPGLMSAIPARRINASDVDVVNLHWTNFGYLSVSDIGHIAKPAVWTLHDMWAFTGGLNYAPDDADARWRSGYRADNRPADGTRWDVDRWVATRKQRHWRTPIHLVTPSAWLADMATQSQLLGSWPVSVIPNPLDTDVYRPTSQQEARDSFGIDHDAVIVLFTLTTDLSDPRKGWDLLKTALQGLKAGPDEEADRIELAVVGHDEPPDSWDPSLPKTHWLGRLSSDLSMSLAYNTADVAVVPSRQDNLPQTATEAQACGIPVVAFDVGGLSDIVDHHRTGYLASALDPTDLGRGLAWVLADPARRRTLGANARQRAQDRWSKAVVARAYVELYEQVREQAGS